MKFRVQAQVKPLDDLLPDTSAMSRDDAITKVKSTLKTHRLMRLMCSTLNAYTFDAPIVARDAEQAALVATGTCTFMTFRVGAYYHDEHGLENLIHDMGYHLKFVHFAIYNETSPPSDT